MPYFRRVSVKNPGLVVVLLDDSKSMRLPMAEGPQDTPKFKLVERSLRAMMDVFMERCLTETRSGSIYRPRYFVQIVAYGADLHPVTDKPEPVADVYDRLSRINPDAFELGEIGLLGNEKTTDSARAFGFALERLAEAVAGPFAHSFPPLLFHLTDGRSQTDAEACASKIRELGTDDGRVLIVNAHIDAATHLAYAKSAEFAGYVAEDEVGMVDYVRRLFRMSSPVPRSLHTYLQLGPFPCLRPESRLFFDARNADMIGHVLAVTGSVGATQRIAGPIAV
jgi:hypothetical protein